ncbi:MAG TPA: hypothetical protein VLT88_14880, partial [Desulfosarcina sp.]|nr:hypothetical protein [Desulfosarcina sp.]
MGVLGMIVSMMVLAPAGCRQEVLRDVAIQSPPEDVAAMSRPAPGDGRGRAADPLLLAEARATPYGREILETGRSMTLARDEIIRGGCWDYANAVYNRAGYPDRKRKTVFKSRKAGPYADLGLIQPGDWLYYVNHWYGDIEHSAIFVDWVDFGAGEGLMLSYGGEKRREPARYMVYDVSHTYMIIRPGKD